MKITCPQTVKPFFSYNFGAGAYLFVDRIIPASPFSLMYFSTSRSNDVPIPFPDIPDLQTSLQ